MAVVVLDEYGMKSEEKSGPSGVVALERVRSSAPSMPPLNMELCWNPLLMFPAVSQFDGDTGTDSEVGDPPSR